MSLPGTRQLDFEDVKIYGVTGKVTDKAKLIEQVRQMAEAGLDAFQLRTRELSDVDILKVGAELKNICHANNTLFILNNRPDLAMALDADGVHLGHDDIPIEYARKILGHRKIIGISTHSLPQAIQAQKAGADYISCGPIWATPTKPDYTPVGIELIGLYNAAIRIPFVVIGGVNESNIEDVLKAKAKCVAIVRGLFESNNPSDAVRKFKEKIETNWVSLKQ